MNVLHLTQSTLTGIWALRGDFYRWAVCVMVFIIIGFFVFLLYYLLNNRKMERNLCETDATGLLQYAHFCAQAAQIQATQPGEPRAFLRFTAEDLETYANAYGTEACENFYRDFARSVRTALGGNKDGVLLCHMECGEFASFVPADAVGHFMQTVEERLADFTKPYPFTVRFGVYVAEPGQTTDVRQCVDYSGYALRKAKTEKSKVVYCNETLADTYDDLRERIARLPDAVKTGELQPCFLPLLLVDTEEICGAEVHLLWQHPNRGLLPEETVRDVICACGAEEAVFETVLTYVLESYRKWKEQGLSVPVITLFMPETERALSLFRNAVTDAGTDGTLQIAVDGAASERFRKIVSEARVPAEYQNLRDGFTQLQKGQTVCRLPFHADRQAKTDDESQMQIRRALCRMAHTAGIPVLACDVDTEEDVNAAVALDCDVMVGKGVSVPLDADGFADFLRMEKVATLPLSVKTGLNLLDENAETELVMNEYIGAACIVYADANEVLPTKPSVRFLAEIGCNDTPEAFSGKRWLENLPKAAREIFVDTVEKAKSGGGVANCEITTEISEGKPSYLRFTLRYLKRRAKKSLLLCTVRDVTAKKREAAIRNAREECFSMVVDCIPGGVARFRYEKNQLVSDYFSPQYYEMRGYSADEMANMKNEDLLADIHTDDRNHLADLLTQCLDKREAVQMTYRVYRKDGRIIWIEMNARCTEDAQGQYLFVYCAEFKPAEELDLLPPARSERIKLKRVVEPVQEFLMEEDILMRDEGNDDADGEDE